MNGFNLSLGAQDVMLSAESDSGGTEVKDIDLCVCEHACVGVGVCVCVQCKSS